MNGHPTREEDFDLYALGALEGDEKQAIESHIAACADCARKLAEARGRLAALSFAAPRVDASPRVKEQLLARVRAEGEGGTPSPSRSQRGAESAAGRGGFFGRWWAAVLAPVGVALAVATIFLWNQNERLDRELANLRQTAGLQQRNLEEAQHALEEAQHAADLLAERDTIVVPLMPMPGVAKGMGRVTYNEHMGMLMYDGNLGPAPTDKSYQLWLVPIEGDPINAGVFNPKSGQTDHWMMQLPPGVAPKAFAVTLEPAGGMPHPTGPKVLVGGVS
jgi:anti-sigma-K factor RskA